MSHYFDELNQLTPLKYKRLMYGEWVGPTKSAPVDPCPNCDCSLSADWHAACHEMWEVGQANAREYNTKHNSMTVEIEHNGVTYRGTLYPVEN